MAEDIAPELLEKIQEEFRKNCSQDKELQEISRKVADGTANCVDLENYAIAAGDMLAKALHNNVSGDILPDGKMYYNIASRILPPNLEECHVMVADIAEGIYGVLNEKAGIHIKAQRPDLNRDRIDGIVDYVSNAEQYEDVRKSTEQSIVNFSQSVATDAVHKNADFQYKAGLSPKIRRSAEGNCCKWCQSLEGTYDYADVRNTGNDVWRRHRDCRCEVTYDPGTGKVQNAYSKKWDWKEENQEKKSKIIVFDTVDSPLRQTGGKITGGHRYPKEEYDTEKETQAKAAYERYSREDDSVTISRNTGFSQEDIQIIRSHIFFKKHDLDDGYRRFYPDYDMAVAWKRLQNGDYLPRDITLLNHELLESRLEKEYDLSAGEAHEMAQKTYNWARQMLEETSGKGEDDGLL